MIFHPGETPDDSGRTMYQIQTIQPLPAIMPMPLVLPLRQRQSLVSPVGPFDDDSDSIISSSIVTVTNNNTFPFNLPVILVTSSPYLATSTDVVIGVNNTGLVPFSIVLPANPATGKFYIIKDVSGTAQAEPITVTAVGHLIDGSANATINANYGSITLVFNGLDWSII